MVAISSCQRGVQRRGCQGTTMQQLISEKKGEGKEKFALEKKKKLVLNELK